MNGETDIQGMNGTTPTPETQPAQSGDAGAKSFTQQDIDRILAERLKRAEESMMKKIIADLGVDSLDSVKSVITAQKEADEARKSDVQKAADRAAALEKQLREKEAALNALMTARKVDRRNAALANALRDAKAQNTDDLLVILNGKYAEELDALTDDDGNVDDKAVKAMIEKARKNHSVFFAAASPGSPSNRDGSVRDKSFEERLKAATAGRPIIKF